MKISVVLTMAFFLGFVSYTAESVFAETVKETTGASDMIQNDGGDCTLTLEAYGGGNAPTSYLLPVDQGWMTVRFIKEGVAINADGQIVVDTFDSDFHMSSRKVISGELPIWGGFYAASDAYYLVTGQDNLNQNENLEVFRITKYDLNWNRVKSVGLSDCNTTVPFGYGCAIDMEGKNLVVHTCHVMYTSYDGHRHQANATIMIDTDKMEITDKVTSVGGIGYVSHSFDQKVGFDGNSIVMVDLGDAYPRAAVIQKADYNLSNGKLQLEYSDYDKKSLHIMDFYGETGDNYVGANIGGFEIMDHSYLVVGSSVVQDERYAERKTRNVYVAAADKDLNDKSLSWLTSYAEGDGTVTTPQTVKISNNSCMVFWSRQNIVYYTMIDENGNQTSPIYQHKGFISSCKPVLYQERIYWYTVDGYSLDFYSISTASPDDFRVKETCDGHQCKVDDVISGIANVQCTVCNQKISLKTPEEFEPAWNLTGHDGGVVGYSWLSEAESIKINTGDKIYITFDELEVEIAISDESKLSYTREEYFDGYFTALADGNVKVSVNPKWNPDLKTTFRVKIGNVPEDPEDEDLGYENQDSEDLIEDVQESRTSVIKLVPGKKKITVKYRKVDLTDIKYQIAVKKFGTSKWKRYNTGSTSRVIKKLTSKGMYYVKVRPYKEIQGSIYYGKWSGIKSVWTK